MKKYVVSVKTSKGINYLSYLLLVFNRRKIDIIDLNIYRVEHKEYVKFNIVFNADDIMANNISKQINKQIDVQEVNLYLWETVAHDELAVFSLHKTEDHKKMVLKDLAKEHKAKLKVLDEIYLVEKIGSREEIYALHAELKAHHILDFSYSGPIGVLNSNIHKELTV